MNETADIVVVGAGIIGMSTAFQIARRSKARVVVLDKGVGPGEGSTGASSAVCRFRYSYSEIVQLARDGIAAYQHWPEFLEVQAPNARYHNIGVLWITGDRDWTSREVERLTKLGLRTEAMDDRDVADAFPMVRTCTVPPDLVTGEPHACEGGGLHLFERDGGYMDPVDALQDLIATARARGVDVRFNSQVDDLVINNGEAAGVRLRSGQTIAAGSVVLAGGPWSAQILDRHGLGGHWPLEPTRIQIVHIDRPAGTEGNMPVCVDMPGGIYFRPQNRGQQIIVGSVREEDELERVNDPDDYANYVDDDFTHAKLHGLQHRLGIEEIRGHVRGYSGLYTINRADMHPVVGESPIRNLHVAIGCSGHGFKLAPAIGSLLAQELTGDRIDFDTSMDPRFLAFGRAPIRLAAMNVLA